MTMRYLFTCLFLIACTTATGSDRLYEGTWKTTNRKLDGTMTCAVKPLAKQRWKARFAGVWQGVSFDYIVYFTGPENALRCATKVDGAAYLCRASMTSDKFKATFGGDRYVGSFELTRIPALKISRGPGPRRVRP